MQPFNNFTHLALGGMQHIDAPAILVSTNLL